MPPVVSWQTNITGAGLITASRQMFGLLMLQYAGYFLLIIPIIGGTGGGVRRPGVLPGPVTPEQLSFRPGWERLLYRRGRF
jgi:hypothetical protein